MSRAARAAATQRETDFRTGVLRGDRFSGLRLALLLTDSAGMHRRHAQATSHKPHDGEAPLREYSYHCKLQSLDTLPLCSAQIKALL